MTPPHAGQIIVIAKAPVPGRVKTRLSPPCSPDEAARLAAAALADTLAAVRATPVRRRVVAFDGDPRSADLTGFDVLPQRGVGLGERLAHAFADAAAGAGAGLPTFLVGMDTPQLTPALLGGAFTAMAGAYTAVAGSDTAMAGADTAVAGADAVLGHAPDGGWWGLGVTDPAYAAALAHVPMSETDTGALTELALTGQGIRLALLSELPDVDTFDEALAVAQHIPDSRFAQELAAIMSGATQ